jgi:hypothetical protein
MGKLFQFVTSKQVVDCRPMVVNGEIIDGYHVMPDGNIVSTKRKKPKILTPQISDKDPYPRVSVRMNGKSTTPYVHRLVCEAFHPFPVPPGVTKSEWRDTPNSVKRLVFSMFQVNHIDHVHGNFHPDNLEWVTVKQNAAKYQAHRVS